MFKDEEETIEQEVIAALELFTLEDILEHNDLTVEEAIVALVREGIIELPEVRPVR
jgi:hypothetical protein